MDGVCGMEETSGGFMGQMTRAAATGEGWYRACWWWSVSLPPLQHSPVDMRTECSTPTSYWIEMPYVNVILPSSVKLLGWFVPLTLHTPSCVLYTVSTRVEITLSRTKYYNCEGKHLSMKSLPIDTRSPHPRFEVLADVQLKILYFWDMTLRPRMGIWIFGDHHHHHHHQSFMELGHLLTRSGLTHPEVSLTVYHDFFCQLGNIIS